MSGTASEQRSRSRLPHARSPAVAVTLVDGSIQDLGALSAGQLRELHWQQEQAFAQEILAAPKGSPARAEMVRRAYDTIVTIMDRYRSGQSGDYGLNLPLSTSLVQSLLSRQRRRGEDARFFEIGFGQGRLLKWVADAGYPVAGIDVSSVLHQRARDLLGPAHANVLYLGSLSDDLVGSLEGKFSLVYSNDVVEHVPPDELPDFLRRAFRLLRPGGILVTLTPNWHVRPSDVTRQWCPPRTQARGLHLKEYTLREMTCLLRQAGFRDIRAPLFRTRRRCFLCAGGLVGWKRRFEPVLEALPYRLTRLLCAGLALYCTLAVREDS